MILSPPPAWRKRAESTPNVVAYRKTVPKTVSSRQLTGGSPGPSNAVLGDSSSSALFRRLKRAPRRTKPTQLHAGLPVSPQGSKALQPPQKEGKKAPNRSQHRTPRSASGKPEHQVEHSTRRVSHGA